MILGFAATVALVVLGVHFYLWHRLVRATTVPGRLRRVLTVALVALGVLVPVTFVGSRMEWGHWLAWPGFLWLAVMFYLVVYLVVLEVPRFVANRAVRRGVGDRMPVGSKLARPAGVPSGAAATSATVASPAAASASASVVGAATADAPTATAQVATEPAAASSTPPATAPGPELVTRRLFVARTAALAAGVGALGTVGYGISTALGDPVIEPVKVTLPKLDPRLSGLRFAVVSDIHLGPLTGLGHSERIVRMINNLKPDVVAIVGDLVDGTVAELGRFAQPLGELRSRYGAYFVTGNHEYYTANGPDEWVQELDELGVRSLRNSRVEIAHGGAVLDLAGVNDVNGTSYDDGPDFEAALGGRDPGRSTVLLAHQPLQVRQASAFGVDLQLSGHTHGGQMVPFNLVVPLQQPVVSGLETVDGVQVYVTRGAGFWGPPVRVGAPPEITLLEIGAAG
ncbi:metallophosphoesterase [Nonomuraea sp. NPDC050663]|uniref:metallophosphoesterase n=1 Tax=Nonomuraea sp. NPDC050663 TaxID=3364370 RepID=UPI0037A79CF0